MGTRLQDEMAASNARIDALLKANPRYKKIKQKSDIADQRAADLPAIVDALERQQNMIKAILDRAGGARQVNKFNKSVGDTMYPRAKK